MKKNSMKKNAILNITKQICQILFSLITIPYVTRILGTELYGAVNYGNSIVSYFALISALGISTYGIREGALVRDDKRSISKLASELLSLNIMSMFLAYSLLFMLLCTSTFKHYRVLIIIQSLTILFTTIGMDWLNSVYEDYFFITIRYIAFQLSALIAMLLLVKNPGDYFIYAFLVVMASAGANIANYFHTRKYVNISLTIRGIKKHIKPILILFGNAVAITIYVNSDITMVGVYQGDKSVGIYSLASRIYSVIKLVINGMVLVTVPRLSRYFGQKDKVHWNGLLSKIFMVLIMFMLPASAGIIALAPKVMEIMGGSEYICGADALQILGGAIFFSLIAFFFSNCILIPSKNERIVFRATLFSAILNVILNVGFIPKMDYLGAAITTLIAEVFVAIVTGGFSYKKKLWKINLQSRDLISVFIGTIVVYYICKLFVNYTNNSLMCVVVAVGISIVIYFLILIILKNSILIEELKKIMRKI